MVNPSVPTSRCWHVAGGCTQLHSTPPPPLGARRPTSGDRDVIVGSNQWQGRVVHRFLSPCPKLLLLGAGSDGRRTAVVTITVVLPLRLDRSLNDNTEASDR